MSVSLSFHVIGLALWLIGLMALTMVLRLGLVHTQSVALAKSAVKRTLFAFVIPGFAVTLLSGLHQFAARGAAFYMQQGWFHTKLTLLLILIALTAFVYRDSANFLADRAPTLGRIKLYHILSGVLLLAIVLTTMLGRTAN